jgi:DNA-binding GntR family transcriptional regulator
VKAEERVAELPAKARERVRIDHLPSKTSERVYEAMKDEIIIGRLPPGSIISELALAERYKTSRTPVREACQFLQKDGLLEAVPHKGFFVAEITVKQIQDIYQLRFILESTCARLAAERATKQDLAELDTLARPINFSASDREAFWRSCELNRKFHLAIARIAGNQELSKILANILDKISRAQYMEAKYAPMVVGPEHVDIVKTIRQHDPAAADKAMVAHIQSSVDHLVSALFSSSKLQSR